MFNRLDISIQMEFNKSAGQKIPVLSVIDNGWGMSHLDIERMVSFGHARPTEDNRDHIGRFGVGFKVISNLLLFNILTGLFIDYF
jgi:HSP90 family molecular chaperone